MDPGSISDSACARARSLAAAAAICASLAVATSAAGRTVEVRWKAREPTEGVAGFKIYSRFTDKLYGAGRDVGLPPVVDGVYSVPIEVSDTDATWVAISVYDAQGVESPLSNERLFLLPDP